MEFLAAFPDAEFNLSSYFLMEADHHGFNSQELVSSYHQDNMMMAAMGDEVITHQSLLCSFAPMEMMNYNSTTTTTTNSSTDCSGNNSPLFDPAAHFLNVHEESANYSNIPMSISNGVSSMGWQLKRKLDNLELSEIPQSKRKCQKSSSCSVSPNRDEEMVSNMMNNNNNNNNNNVAYNNSGRGGQSSSSCNSEEEMECSNNNGDSSKIFAKKTSSKASRGSATDPQSLYARKRRERINERLRMLQTLVPNGTKVDISTMLEEAVHYVKYLQLQIKLLSSDDLWMYAPIAYNGVDVGLNQKLSTLL
ncbi:unnamed protein product [Linum trigynum]|uniref:BHLH domain-containing protein n=1 Tax=Linum trigynum TaxID=586398 RepID=A0AAV2GIP1_9ROSI